MAAPKKPQDHLQKKPKPVDIEIELADPTEDDPKRTRTVPGKQVTIDDIEVKVPDEALDDFEFLDDLRAMQDTEDASRLPSLLRRLVVAEDYRRVLNALRDETTGRVSIEAGSTFVMGLIEALNPSS